MGDGSRAVRKVTDAVYIRWAFMSSKLFSSWNSHVSWMITRGWRNNDSPDNEFFVPWWLNAHLFENVTVLLVGKRLLGDASLVLPFGPALHRSERSRLGLVRLVWALVHFPKSHCDGVSIASATAHFEDGERKLFWERLMLS